MIGDLILPHPVGCYDFSLSAFLPIGVVFAIFGNKLQLCSINKGLSFSDDS